jgi:hypothetical protein
MSLWQALMERSMQYHAGRIRLVTGSINDTSRLVDTQQVTCADFGVMKAKGIN